MTHGCEAQTPRLARRAHLVAACDARVARPSGRGRRDRGPPALATSVATCFAVLALTGVALMTTYSPSPQSAWASVFYVQFVESNGWVVRGFHFWAAQSLFVLAGLHIVHGALCASYRTPREIAWWLTLLVIALAIAEGITGGLLPWDQRGWWARVVEGNIVGLAPGIGGWIQQMILGGSELGALGLTRAYAIHVVVLPLVLCVVLWTRRSLVQRHGWHGETGPTRPYSKQLARSAVVGAVVVLALFALITATHGAPLESPADPMSDYPARPEWFLLPLFELRKFFHGSMEFFGTTTAPLVAGLYFAMLPWLDKPSRSRALSLAPAGAIVAGVLALAVAPSRKDAHDEHYAKQRAKVDARRLPPWSWHMKGVPPAGALAMVRQDPELRGRDLFEQHCASCHVMGDLGDPKKATATKLDGWGTTQLDHRDDARPRRRRILRSRALQAADAQR